MNHNKTPTRFNIGDRVSRTDSWSPVGIVRNKIITPPPRWQEDGVEQISYNVMYPTIGSQEVVREEDLRLEPNTFI